MSSNNSSDTDTLVSAWEVLDSIGSSFDFSAAERATTLRLGDEVPPLQNPAAPSPLSGRTMGELRDEVVAGLAQSFARATKISRSAAVLHYVLHHVDAPPELFDMRLTGLPLLSDSAFAELQSVLAQTARFERRLIEALGKGKFRDFPRHGGPHGVGISPDDWTSSPSDPETLRNLAFRAAEIKALLVDVPHGAMHDALTGQVIPDFLETPDLSGSSDASAIELSEPPRQVQESDQAVAPDRKQAAAKGKKRGRSGDPAIREAVRRTLMQGIQDRSLGLSQAFLVLRDLALNDELGLRYLPKDEDKADSVAGIHYLHDDKLKPLSQRAFKARAGVFWDELQKLETPPAIARPPKL